MDRSSTGESQTFEGLSMNADIGRAYELRPSVVATIKRDDLALLTGLP